MSDFEIPDGAVVTDVRFARGGKGVYANRRIQRRELIRPRMPSGGHCTVFHIDWFYADPNGNRKTAGTFKWRPAMNDCKNTGCTRVLSQHLFWATLKYIDEQLGLTEADGAGCMDPEDVQEFIRSGNDVQKWRQKRYGETEADQHRAKVDARMKRQQDRIQAQDDAIMEPKGEEITVICRIADDKIVHRALPGHGVRMIWEEVPLAENKAVRRENGYDAYIRDETELAKKRLKETLANQIPSPPKVRLCVCGKPLEYYVEIHDDHTTWTRFIAPRFQCSANPEVDAGSHQ